MPLEEKAVDLSVVITSYKNPELLRLCIDSIKKEVQGILYEIIVADSATEEDTDLMMREEYPEIKFFSHAENVGFQKLVTMGIQGSLGAFILFLNGDIIVTKESVEKLFYYLKEHLGVGMIGPKLLNFNGTFQYSCFRFYRPMTILYRRTFLGRLPFGKKHLDWFLMKDKHHDKTMEVDWLMGSALMMRRSAIEKVGLMDSRFFMYMEDVDWCRRFWENDLKIVYYPQSQMYHYHGKGSGKGNILSSLLFNRLTWIHIVSAVKYFNKYRGKKLPQHA